MLGVLAVIGLFAGLGYVLGLINRASQGGSQSLVEQINQLLPQTQCAQCGFPGCRPYAEAIVDEEVAINRCPPGGQATVDALARLLGQPTSRLDPLFGSPKPTQVAWIDELRCIGCALCLPACPVDAILGAARHMHTVIASECTGCELCLPPCPVDCIELREMPEQSFQGLRDA